MADTKPHYERIAAAALSSLSTVLDWLGIGSGKREGDELAFPSLANPDERTPSLKINTTTGAWAEFNSNAVGGDVVSFAAHVRRCAMHEAANAIAARLGIDGLPRRDTINRASSGERDAAKGKTPPTQAKPQGGPKAQADGAVCAMPVPDDAPSPPASHSRHGKPAKRWAYVAADGRVNFYHDRFEPKAAGERKQFAPLTLWRTAAGRLEWRYKAPPAPRPLLGLPELTAKAAPAIFTEGEKARDAAAALLPDHPVLNWQGGAQAVSKADFSPLAGRECWLWADNDEAGAGAMQAAAKALREAGAGPLKRFDLQAFAHAAGMEDGAAVLTPGDPLQAGDDAADLIERGWTAVHLRLLLDRSDTLLPCAAEPAKVGAGGTVAEAAASAEGPAKRFELTERGVMFNDPERGARWICAPLEVVALVRSPENHGWGLLVEFSDPDRKPHRVIVPMALFRGDGVEVAGLLLDRGLKIAPKGKPLLLEYLQTARTDQRARVTGRTGWHDAQGDGAVFVLPDQAIGMGADEWIFESEAATANTFKARGTLKGWQAEVAALCAGNSRLMFAVSAAFAAPLLYLAGAESGGFHFRSNSSDGKTTALRVAASVCGRPDYMQRWRATDNGLEALATQHCDALLLLDELAQIDPKAAGEVAYMLANGGGKARAGRTGAARERASWRVLFLSAGEIGLAEHMGEIGKTPRAGQELRLAEIPADAGAGLGIFEDLHGCASGSEFAKALTEAARRNHGGAFAAYLDALARHQSAAAETVREVVKKFEAACLSDGAHGQARRVAGRFALVGAGGELATKFGVTGWPAGAAMAAARTCFEAWLSRRGGEGNQETRAMLGQVREFLRRYGESAFSDMERPANDSDKHAPVRADRAGYRRHDKESDATEYYIFAEVWRARVCKGYDPAAVGRLMAERGYVEKGTEAGREWLVKKSLPTEGGRPRVVHVLPTIWDDGDD